MRSGAQRASGHRLVAAVFAATFLATLVVVPLSPVVTGGQVAQATVTAPWLTAEQWYLKLLNCTRTGGWVRSDGSCDGYGSGAYSRYVTPLKLHLSVSNRVARPWARYLAVNARCAHGDPGARMRRAGFTSWRWGENIGCGDGWTSARASVLDSHLRFQAEQPDNGGHWVNIKNPTYTYVGIGIWRYAARTRLVTDFYRPG